MAMRWKFVWQLTILSFLGSAIVSTVVAIWIWVWTETTLYQIAMNRKEWRWSSKNGCLVQQKWCWSSQKTAVRSLGWRYGTKKTESLKRDQNLQVPGPWNSCGFVLFFECSFLGHAPFSNTTRLHMSPPHQQSSLVINGSALCDNLRAHSAGDDSRSEAMRSSEFIQNNMGGS